MPALLLHPAEPGWRPEGPGQLRDCLRRIGLIGEPAPGGGPDYLAGPRFLQQVVFLGCSPNLRLAPDPADPEAAYCHVRLPPAAAGAARRCPVEIEGVHPHEAVPADSLLAALAALSSCDWRWSYR